MYISTVTAAWFYIWLLKSGHDSIFQSQMSWPSILVSLNAIIWLARVIDSFLLYCSFNNGPINQISTVRCSSISNIKKNLTVKSHFDMLSCPLFGHNPYILLNNLSIVHLCRVIVSSDFDTCFLLSKFELENSLLIYLFYH